jgi:hypothetical protein
MGDLVDEREGDGKREAARAVNPKAAGSAGGDVDAFRKKGATAGD